MKIISTLLFLLLPGFIANAQSWIEGKVTDKKGEPVIGANVFIVDSYDGASTGVDGSFKFKTSEEGERILRVTFIGYETYDMPITLPKEKLSVQVTLEEAVNRLDAVVISAGSFTAGEESNREVLKPLDIVTTAGATGDIAGALNTLPGTQKVGETGRLFIRGGEGYETKTFIDGIEVLDAYAPSAPNTPGRSRFSAFMFSGTSFSTGGYSAEYGQALSSALILKSKDVPEATRTDLGLMSVGADVAHTQRLKDGALAGKIQYTNLTPYFEAVSQRIDWENAPQAIDGNLMFRKEVTKNTQIKLYSNFNWSDFTIYRPQIADPKLNDKIGQTNQYNYINTSVKSILNDQWSIVSGISYTRTDEDVQFNAEQLKEKEHGVHIKSVVADDISEKFSLSFGVEHFIRNYDFAYANSEDVAAKGTLAFDLNLTAAFVEADIYTSNHFVTRAGVRSEYNQLQDKFYVVPRLSLAYKTGENSQVSLAYGQFNETGPNDLVRMRTDLEDEKADHYIVNYQREVDGRTFRIEGYYKDYKNLIKFGGGNSPDPGTYNNQGTGYARGFDIFWRDNKSLKGVDYWLSYSYLDTERDYRNFPYEVTPTFASKHNLSAVFKYFIRSLKAQVGGSYSFASGRPYNNPNNDDFNGQMTRAYHDLSLNVSYLMRSNIIIHGSVTNVLGFDNVFGYESSADENGVYVLRPIKQAAPRFIFLGVFITLSKDKSINQLPNL